ncbi:putative NmrA-like family domain-containing protein 1 [Glarea lozoyensis 74030]|uniref:Putative NmrA-like family domain-containing protein 1 n=1 Tax=Glarea lozoyensis (strain ATCC 74030 / MF5533) TaxID=1104152 RepID=H0EPB8_GLAL7|nr:putative NmrA-like family domain-containing protein 1 [Glarea lozoyensis 74030]
MTKTIVIIAVTGNQGSSVAEVFLQIPGWHVKGVTRNLTSLAALALAAKGVELVVGDTNHVETIKAAVQGASIVFGNTAFSDALANPASPDLVHLKEGQSVREMCYDLEFQQGKNIADAVATVRDLEMFIWSSLSDAKKWSGGKYPGVYHFDCKAHVIDYIEEKYPELAARMNVLMMGLFVTNWKWGEASVPWKKLPDGTMRLRVPGSGDVPIPFVVPKDAGNFVKALAVEEHAALTPGSGQGMEMAEMYGYAQDFGYEAEADPSITYSSDVNPKIPRTSIEEYIRGEDWSSLGL